MSKKDITVEVETTQKVNNADGTQTEIKVKERRLKKAHDKQMAKMQARQRRAASDFPAPQEATESSAEVKADAPSVKPSKADRRKKSEPVPAPETESPAADAGSSDSESSDSAAE